MINGTPRFYKIIIEKLLWYSNHANLAQNDAQVFYKHIDQKIRALNPEIIDKSLSGN